MNSNSKKQKKWVELIVVILILALFITPRAVDLDRFITIDEGLWMYHSSQFYYALGQREFENTYQRFHPGVPMMWAGTFGFLVEYPEFRGLGQGYLDGGRKLGKFLEQNGKSPLDLVVAGRWFMIVQNAVLFLLAYWALRQLLPVGVAAPVLGIVSLEPFFVSLTYILQMDGLMASYMFVSILSLLAYLYGRNESLKGWRKNIFFLLSSVMAGAAVLTKAPAVFLLPYAGLMLGIRLIEQRGFSFKAIVKRLVLPLLIWLLIALLVMVVLWPALWVNPFGTMSEILAQSSNRLNQGIGFILFFNGHTLNAREFPWYFYPLSFVWRSSPAVLTGLFIAVLTRVKRWGIFREEKSRRLLVGLVLSGIFFTIEMSLGAMKMDRYIIPVHLILASMSIMGWVALSQQIASSWLNKEKLGGINRWAVLLVVLPLFASQMRQLIGTYPYYYAYYNPLLGGTKGAEEMFWLGWGEGLERVGAYLNEKPDTQHLSVMSFHAYGPLSFYFDGETIQKPWPEDLPFSILEDLDYMVIYVSERQTNHHLPVLEVLDRYEPELTVTINEVDYARLYPMDELSSGDWESLRSQLPSE